MDLGAVGEKQNVVTQIVQKQCRDYRLVCDILVEVLEFATEGLRHSRPTVPTECKRSQLRKKLFRIL